VEFKELSHALFICVSDQFAMKWIWSKF